MELFIVILIVGLSAVYTAKTFYGKYKAGSQADSGSGCGCASCGDDSACRGSGPVDPLQRCDGSGKPWRWV